MSVQTDTIVAVSSPPGRSARGLVRLSGDGVLSILGDLLLPPAGSVEGVRVWPISGKYVPWALKLDGFRLPVLIGYSQSPNSYTGQDVSEIQIPGNPALLSRLVAHIMTLGARLAEPGEFTFRAFTSGKLDLTEAEGVAATIDAESAEQLRAANALVGGELRLFAEHVVAMISDALALVEAGIDFVDQDDVVPIGPADLDHRLVKLETKLGDLLGRCRSWSAMQAVARVVLVGLPSVGKSTLFNALLGWRRSVIAQATGTTRDAIEELAEFESSCGDRIELMLVDLPGLDVIGAGLDRRIQIFARKVIEESDVLVVVDDGRGVPPCSLDQAGGNDSKPLIRVRTKADLDEIDNADGQWDCVVSGMTGKGLEQLRHTIVDSVGRRRSSSSGQQMALQPRHEAAIRGALQAVQKVRGLLGSQLESKALHCIELVAAGLREGLDQMSGLGGQMSPDDVIGKVFSSFCVGK